MFNFHKNHKHLVGSAFTGFVVLSLMVAVIPAFRSQENTRPLPQMDPMSEAELRGLKIFIQEGCVACHTQQVRSIEMDKVWGERPSIPSDYYYSKKRLGIWQQSPSLLGSERTGPDLSNIGKRQPSEEWHLLHLYNPRIVVPGSIMPSYPWLFDEIDNRRQTDEALTIPNRTNSKKIIIPTQHARDLVSYLQSLRQAPLTADQPLFIPSKSSATKNINPNNKNESLVDGEKLYMSTCAACHQNNGSGLPGAFPPLAGSRIVNDQDPELFIKIILQGYDARPEYAQMPAFYDQLTVEEITAIVNHERSSWGNDAPPVSEDEVKKIKEYVMTQIQ